MLKWYFQATRGLGILIPLHLAQRATRHDFSAVNSCTRSKIDDVIGSPHGFLIVLDNNERVSFVPQRGERFQQAQVIARLETDRRLIQYVQDTTQLGA